MIFKNFYCRLWEKLSTNEEIGHKEEFKLFHYLFNINKLKLFIKYFKSYRVKNVLVR